MLSKGRHVGNDVRVGADRGDGTASLGAGRQDGGSGGGIASLGAGRQDGGSGGGTASLGAGRQDGGPREACRE